MLRLLAAAAALLILIIFGMVATAAVVFAQEAVPVAAPSVMPEWLLWLIQSVIAVVGSVLAGVSVYLGRNSPEWLRSIFARNGAEFDLKKTLDAMHWEDHVAKVIANAFGYAAADIQKSDASEVKTPAEAAAFLDAANRYIARQNGEVLQEHGAWTNELLENKLAQASGVRPASLTGPAERRAPRAAREPARVNDSAGMLTPAAMAAHRRNKRDTGDL